MELSKGAGGVHVSARAEGEVANPGTMLACRSAGLSPRLWVGSLFSTGWRLVTKGDCERQLCQRPIFLRVARDLDNGRKVPRGASLEFGLGIAPVAT